MNSLSLPVGKRIIHLIGETGRWGELDIHWALVGKGCGYTNPDPQCDPLLLWTCGPSNHVLLLLFLSPSEEHQRADSPQCCGSMLFLQLLQWAWVWKRDVAPRPSLSEGTGDSTVSPSHTKMVVLIKVWELASYLSCWWACTISQNCGPEEGHMMAFGHQISSGPSLCFAVCVCMCAWFTSI